MASSYCDRIILRNTATGEMVEYHVEEVKTDLIVSPRTTQVVLYEFKEHVAKYSPLVISENIHNYYDGTTNFTMSAYYDGLQPIGNQTITLNPLESGDAIVTWNLTVTLPMGTYSYNITINTYANNTLLYSTVIPITFKITIVGDINGDGIVDMSDIGEAAMAFLSQLGEPRWNPNADTNGDTYLWPDGLVDLQDIGLIASKFLHTDP